MPKRHLKSVNILGKRTKIVSRIPKKYRGKFEPSSYAGLYFGIDNTIWLNPEFPTDATNVTAIHEICHGIMHRTGLDQVIDDSIAEVICESFANFFADHCEIVFDED